MRSVRWNLNVKEWGKPAHTYYFDDKEIADAVYKVLLGRERIQVSMVEIVETTEELKKNFEGPMDCTVYV